MRELDPVRQTDPEAKDEAKRFQPSKQCYHRSKVTSKSEAFSNLKRGSSEHIGEARPDDRRALQQKTDAFEMESHDFGMQLPSLNTNIPHKLGHLSLSRVLPSSPHFVKSTDLINRRDNTAVLTHRDDTFTPACQADVSQTYCQDAETINHSKLQGLEHNSCSSPGTEVMSDEDSEEYAPNVSSIDDSDYSIGDGKYKPNNDKSRPRAAEHFGKPAVKLTASSKDFRMLKDNSYVQPALQNDTTIETVKGRKSSKLNCVDETSAQGTARTAIAIKTFEDCPQVKSFKACCNCVHHDLNERMCWLDVHVRMPSSDVLFQTYAAGN